jgi:hypothetical protein
MKQEQYHPTYVCTVELQQSKHSTPLTFYMFSSLLIGALGPHHAYLFTQILQIQNI